MRARAPSIEWSFLHTYRNGGSHSTDLPSGEPRHFPISPVCSVDASANKSALVPILVLSFPLPSCRQSLISNCRRLWEPANPSPRPSVCSLSYKQTQGYGIFPFPIFRRQRIFSNMILSLIGGLVLIGYVASKYCKGSLSSPG